LPSIPFSLRSAGNRKEGLKEANCFTMKLWSAFDMSSQAVQVIGPGLQAIYYPLGGQNRIDNAFFDYIFHQVRIRAAAFFLCDRQSALRFYVSHPIGTISADPC
jgi:hypothetical protein